MLGCSSADLLVGGRLDSVQHLEEGLKGGGRALQPTLLALIGNDILLL